MIFISRPEFLEFYATRKDYANYFILLSNESGFVIFILLSSVLKIVKNSYSLAIRIL